jgi:fructokinase
VSGPAEPSIIVGIGELLWDVFDDIRRPGGAPANVAFHAQQLGDRGVICSRVGSDPLGDELLAYLATKGLETDFVQRDAKHGTGMVTVEAVRADSPTYRIHDDVAWDYIEFGQGLQELMSRASAVCFGTLAQRHAQTRETIHRCLAAAQNALRVYDVNLRPPWYRQEWIEQSLRQCHAAKLNEGEAQVLAAMMGMEMTTLPGFASALCSRYELDLVCITRAAEGCLLVTPTQTVDEPGTPVHAVDAVGAGDAFSAGLIKGWLRRLPLTSIARLACGLGALVAGHSGAMPVLGEELAALAADIK